MAPRFSSLWFIAVTLVNLIGCAFLAGMIFAVGMSSFSASPGKVEEGLLQIQLFAWIWTTGTMIAYKICGTQEQLLATVAFFWAILLGTVAGFVLPLLTANASRGKPSNPELW